MASEGKIPNKMIFDNPQKEVTTITGLKNREKAEMTISVKKRNVEEIKGIKEGNNIVFIIPNEGDSKNEKIRVIKSLAGLSNSRISNKNLMRRRRNRREIVMGETPFTEKQIEGAKVVKIAKNEAEKTNYIVTYNEKNNTIKKVYKTKVFIQSRVMPEYFYYHFNTAFNIDSITGTFDVDSGEIIPGNADNDRTFGLTDIYIGGHPGDSYSTAHLDCVVLENVYLGEGAYITYFKAGRAIANSYEKRSYSVMPNHPKGYYHMSPRNYSVSITLKEKGRIDLSRYTGHGGVINLSELWGYSGNYDFENHQHLNVTANIYANAWKSWQYNLLLDNDFIMLHRSPRSHTINIDVNTFHPYDSTSSYLTFSELGLDSDLGYKLHSRTQIYSQGSRVSISGDKVIVPNDLIESGTNYSFEVIWRCPGQDMMYNDSSSAYDHIIWTDEQYINGTPSSGGDIITINFTGKALPSFEIDDPKNELFDFGKIIQGHKKYIDKVIKIKNLKSKKVVNVKFEKNMMDIPKVDDASKTLKVTGDISIIKKGEMKEIPIKVKMIAEATDTQEIGQYKGEVKIIIDIE